LNEQIENNSQVYELAPIKKRAIGFILDMSIYCFCFFVINFSANTLIGNGLKLGSNFMGSPEYGRITGLQISGIVLLEVLHTFALPCFFGGMTPGKKLLKLEILDKDSNEPSIFRLFARNIFGRFFIYCLLIALLIEYAIDSLNHVDTGISVFFLFFISIPTFFTFLLLQIIYFI
jgi:uncharacterized RDD family membrane protein YckC